MRPMTALGRENARSRGRGSNIILIMQLKNCIYHFKRNCTVKIVVLLPA